MTYSYYNNRILYCGIILDKCIKSIVVYNLLYTTLRRFVIRMSLLYGKSHGWCSCRKYNQNRIA